MQLPVHVLEQPAEGAQLQLPKDNLCYLVGSNGVFKHVSNDFYTVNVKTEKIKHLAEVKEHARIHLPKLPFNLLKRIESFFRAAYDKFQSEAVVMLYANPDKEENAWRLEVPKQEVSGGHVKYDLTNIPTEIDGYRLFGTVHSHASMGAFHSGTDDTDEKKFDGLHITIGNINTSMSYSARWIFCSTVFECKLSEWISNPPEGEADPSWLAMISKPEPLYSGYNNGYYGKGGYWDSKEGRWKEGDSRFYDHSDDYFRREGYYKRSGLCNQTQKPATEKAGFQGASTVGNTSAKTGLGVERNKGSEVNESSTTGAAGQLGGGATIDETDPWPKDEYEPIGGTQSAGLGGSTPNEERGREGLGRTDGGGVDGEKKETGLNRTVGTGGAGTTEAAQAQTTDTVVPPGEKDGPGPAAEAVNPDLSQITVKAEDETKIVSPIKDDADDCGDNDLNDLDVEDIITLLNICVTAEEVVELLDDLDSSKILDLKTALNTMRDNGQIDFVDYKEMSDNIADYEEDLQARAEHNYPETMGP